MIPDSPRRANTPATLKINHLPLLNQSAFIPHSVIITPENTIKRKEPINITVVTICINPPTNLGNALIGVAVPSAVTSPFVLIQAPIKGTFVLSFVQQHTPGASQFSHSPFFLFHCTGFHAFISCWHFSLSVRTAGGKSHFVLSSLIVVPEGQGLHTPLSITSFQVQSLTQEPFCHEFPEGHSQI